jgi:hypothetical protein
MRLILAFVFLFAFWMGRNTAEKGLVVPKPFAQQAAKQYSASPLAIAKAPSVTAGRSLKDIIGKSSSGVLFRALFDEKVFTMMPQEEVLNTVRERFQRKYPSGDRPEVADPYTRELVQRIGILKAMSAAFPPGGTVSPEFYDFYRQLLRSEPLMVKRQAMRNLIPWLGSKPEREREQVMKEAGGRVLASAARTDEEILEGAFHEAP